ncbi:MAG: hypothetical protein P9L99_19975 [Candidatus Lernaella stagnicola]|nr:hypothetical protein [Candidatus Lernaella stagnicola]
MTEKVSISFPTRQIAITHKGDLYDLLKTVSVVWNRRPGKPYDDLDDGNKPSSAVQKYVNEQWYSWLESLMIVPNVTWVNHPSANDVMESKIRQLHLASDLGFQVPDTLISNDPEAINSFIGKHRNGVIAKALYSPLIEEPEQDFFIFTNRIDGIAAGDEDSVRVCPSIYQQALFQKTDYRVTVIGKKLFSVRIDSGENQEVNLDWRTQKDGLEFKRCSIPDDIADLCVKLVLENDLYFGAIDIVEHEGRFWFLEVNPNGEWGWLQKPNGVPIAEALCDLMISKRK